MNHKFFSIVFLLFAIIQYNDPDPAIWVMIYGTIAFHLWFINTAWYPSAIRPILISSLCLGLFLYIPDIEAWLNDGMPNIAEEMKASSPYIELVREGLGLVVSIVAIFFLKKKV
jgi:hypothetical protein